ncbi:MAG: hypothetical protein JWO11_4320, partial [Nocardioides sp.]|nr:hypothetical protein [Nocardioides sp.]
GFPEHRKVVAAGGDAAWLHVCALAYASRNLTDGLIPAGVVPRLSDRKQPKKLADKLESIGLWHAADHDCPRCPRPGPDEYVIHDYLVHQRSAEKVEEIKAKRAVAGRSGGTRKAANARSGATPKGKQTPSNLLGQSGGSDAENVVTEWSTPAGNKSNGHGKQKVNDPPAEPDETLIGTVHSLGPPSNLLEERYEPAVAKSYPDTEVVLRTTRAEELLRSSQAEKDLPPTAGAVAPHPAAPVGTDELIADWLDHVPKRPPGQVIGQVGKHVKSMLGEGIDPADVRRGIAAWASKGLHPSALPSVVNEVMNAGRTRDAARGDRRQQATDDMFARAAARAAAREEHPHDPARSRDVVPIRPGVLPPAAHG